MFGGIIGAVAAMQAAANIQAAQIPQGAVYSSSVPGGFTVPPPPSKPSDIDNALDLLGVRAQWTGNYWQLYDSAPRERRGWRVGSVIVAPDASEAEWLAAMKFSLTNSENNHE